MLANSRRISAIVLYLALIACLPLVSGAPFRVLAIYIGSFTLAFLVPTLIAARQEGEKIIWWFVGFGLVGILLFDILSSVVIVKHEFLSGFYILYPIGLVALLVVHAISRGSAVFLQRIKKVICL